jgi:hypothetical protein
LAFSASTCKASISLNSTPNSCVLVESGLYQFLSLAETYVCDLS